MIKPVKDGYIIHIRILPNSKKNEIIKTEDGLKIKITAPPIDGKANKALIEFLAKTLKIPKSSIKIVKGETSKDKSVLFCINNENILKEFFDNLQ